jgi:hypothetical protein
MFRINNKIEEMRVNETKMASIVKLEDMDVVTAKKLAKCHINVAYFMSLVMKDMDSQNEYGIEQKCIEADWDEMKYIDQALEAKMTKHHNKIKALRAMCIYSTTWDGLSITVLKVEIPSIILKIFWLRSLMEEFWSTQRIMLFMIYYKFIKNNSIKNY